VAVAMDGLAADRIVPSALDPRVAVEVATAVAKAAEDVQSCRKRYWQAYEESEREYPAEIFPEGVDGYGESAQSTQILTAMCGVV